MDLDFKQMIFAWIMLMLIKGVRMEKYRVSSVCYGDVCNVGNASQFCSETFKLCRDCEEIRDDCGTVKQPPGCNSYCIEIALRNAPAKKKTNVCHVVSVMMKIDNGKVHAPSRDETYLDVGSKITYSCNEGYEIQGSSELVCLEKGRWSQSAMPHCFDESWKNYKDATIGLSVFASCIVLLGLFCMWLKRQEKEEVSRNSSQQSMQDEEKPFVSNTHQEIEQARQPFIIGDTALTHLSYLNEDESDKTNVRADLAEVQAPNVLMNEQKDKVIVHVIENNVNLINMPAQSPETKDMSQKKNTDTHSDQNKTGNKIRDEKLSTEESGENHPFEETAEQKTFKGTKPLPARTEVVEDFKEAFDVNNTDSPEVVPAEDEKTQLSRNETNQGQTLKKVGMQDRTFAKGDIK